MEFRWRDDDGPLLVVFDSLAPRQLKKIRVGPLLTNRSGLAHALYIHILQKHLNPLWRF